MNLTLRHGVCTTISNANWESVVMIMFLDLFWVRLGLRQEELRQEKGRAGIYALVLLMAFASAGLTADMMLNLSGRFG